jgi:hypothetical protein
MSGFIVRARARLLWRHHDDASVGVMIFGERSPPNAITRHPSIK